MLYSRHARVPAEPQVNHLSAAWQDFPTESRAIDFSSSSSSTTAQLYQLIHEQSTALFADQAAWKTELKVSASSQQVS
jgi:hypothetical protein